MKIVEYLGAFVAVFNFGGVVADAIVPADARQHARNPHTWGLILPDVPGRTADISSLRCRPDGQG